LRDVKRATNCSNGIIVGNINPVLAMDGFYLLFRKVSSTSVNLVEGLLTVTLNPFGRIWIILMMESSM